jgi:hypothetical protein
MAVFFKTEIFYSVLSQICANDFACLTYSIIMYIYIFFCSVIRYLKLNGHFVLFVPYKKFKKTGLVLHAIKN